jgi:hypothetical protein
MINHTNGVSGEIILDSTSDEGIRLTTLHMRYPRMIHSELMTHRVFTRNGRSSRAVPVATLVKEDHYTPHFMKNQPGMVASEELSKEDYDLTVKEWNELAEITKAYVKRWGERQVHKQWANRPLEAFGYIDVLISSTDWANFMALRDDEAAQPEIKSVAELIKQLMDDSTPELLQPGEWHMPYIEHKDYHTVEHLPFNEQNELLRKLSTARCARLSIRPFDGDSSIEKELLRYEKLVVSRPVHASPAEHIATPDILSSMTREKRWVYAEEHGNFHGWRQYRKIIPNNTIEDR